MPGANGRPRKIFQKRDLVEAVRKMGSLNSSGSRAELGEGSIASTSKDLTGRLKRANASSEIGGQLRVMETGVVTTSRRYNELKLKADRKAVELQSLLDTLTMMKLEHDALEKMKSRQTPESDRIGTLTAGIKEASEEIQGKLHYRRLLNHMLQRLERNKVTLHCESMFTQNAFSPFQFRCPALNLRRTTTSSTPQTNPSKVYTPILQAACFINEGIPYM